MADNYIEKQRELYEARKAAWEKAKKQGGRPIRATRPNQSPPKKNTTSPTEEASH